MIRYLLILSIIFFSCSQQKKLQKAEKKVREHPESFNRIGHEWEKLNPCSNDTALMVDTIYQEVLSDFEFDMDSLRTEACDTTKPQQKIVKVPVRCKETIITRTETITDRRREKMQADSIRQYLADIKALHAVNDKLLKDNRECETAGKKKLLHRTLLMGIPLLLIILLLIFRNRIPLKF